MLLDYANVLLGESGVGAHTREALDICVAMGDLPRESVARANLGGYAFYAGRWSEAVEWYTSSREVAVKVGKVIGAAETDLALGEILVLQGKPDEAQGVLRNAVRVLRASGDEYSASYGEMLLARVHLIQGEFLEAEELAAKAVAAFTLLGNRISAFEANLVRASIALEDHRPDGALLIVVESEREARGEAASLQARANLVGARALLALDRLDEAERALVIGLQLARDQGLPYEEALLLKTRAALATRKGGAGSARYADADAALASQMLTSMGAGVSPVPV